MTTRAPFFVVPLAFALACGVRGRAEPGVRIAVLGLAASVAWTLVSLAKIGSTTCYFMEPCLGAVVVCGHAPVPRWSARSRSLLGVAAILQGLWTGTASVTSSARALLEAQAKTRFLDELRSARGGGVFLADDAGIELTLDGRLVDTPFQTTALVGAGRFPRDLWLGDMQRPEVVGLVMTTDLLEMPLDRSSPWDRYDVPMRRALRDEFVFSRASAGYSFYVRR